MNFLIEFLAGFWFLAQLCVKQRIGRHSRSFNKGIEPSFHGTRSINISEQHHSANTVGRVLLYSGPQVLILMNEFSYVLCHTYNVHPSGRWTTNCKLWTSNLSCNFTWLRWNVRSNLEMNKSNWKRVGSSEFQGILSTLLNINNPCMLTLFSYVMAKYSLQKKALKR